MKKKFVFIISMIIYVISINGCNSVVNRAKPTSTVTMDIESISTETTEPTIQMDTTEPLYDLKDIITDVSLRQQIAKDLGKSTNVSTEDLDTIKYINIDDDVTSLDGLEILTNVWCVHIYLTNFNDVEYEKLNSLKALRTICLHSDYYNYISYKDDAVNKEILKAISDIEKVEKICIYCPSGFDGNILADFDYVKKVEFSGFGEWEDSDISGLTNMEKLEHLDLRGNLGYDTMGKYGMNSFPGLGELTNLKYLNLLGCTHFEDIDSVVKLKNLEYLSLTNIYFLTVEDFNKLGELDKLIELEIGSMTAPNTKLIDLEFTKNLPELEKITIEAERYKNLETLTCLDNLEFVLIVLSEEQKAKNIDIITTLEEKGVVVEIREP